VPRQLRTLGLVLSLLGAAALAGCARADDPRGPWQHLTTGSRLELRRDGTFVACTSAGACATGRWQAEPAQHRTGRSRQGTLTFVSTSIVLTTHDQQTARARLHAIPERRYAVLSLSRGLPIEPGPYQRP
jgi:hypothetical protein